MRSTSRSLGGRMARATRRNGVAAELMSTAANTPAMHRRSHTSESMADVDESTSATREP